MSAVPLNNGLKGFCVFTLIIWSAFGCSRVKVNAKLDTPTEFQELKESGLGAGVGIRVGIRIHGMHGYIKTNQRGNGKRARGNRRGRSSARS